MPACLRHTELPNCSKLFADFTYHHDRVERFYEGAPLDDASYAEAARRVEYPDSRRAAMAAVLREFNGESPGLTLFEQPGTVAVVTGQQVGLFSGPCYTIYKALTAAKLAARLRDSGIPAVPVFWLASEDHDFEEVRRAWTFDASYAPVSHSVAFAGAGQAPVGGIAPGDYPVAELRESMRGLPFADDLMAAVEASYRPGATMSDAFHALLRRLLPDLGLLYLDPMRPAARAIAAPLIRRAVENADVLTERLLARNQELLDAGYHAQVHFEARNSLFFLLRDGKRISLRREGGAYVHASGRLTADELAARAAEISPNALLRPVAQDYMLPSVAQIGGPAEIAYLAQTQTLYHALDRRGPVVLARAGFTLLDSRASKLMSRYELAIPSFYDGEAALMERVAGRLVPRDLKESVAAAVAAIRSELDRVSGDLARFDPTLDSALSKSRAKILHQIGKIEAKTARESLRRDGRARAEASYLYSLIYPGKHLQERLYTILPFLAKHGMDLVERIHGEVRLECPDHVVLTV